MIKDISVNSLVENSHCRVVEYYRSEKVKAYAVEVELFLPTYRNIEHELLSNQKFSIFLDLSMRWDMREIEAIDLTPSKTMASEFTKWLGNTLGQNFLTSYYYEIFNLVDQAHGEQPKYHGGVL